MNRVFCIFLLIFCEAANHFVAVCKILVVKGIVLVVKGLNKNQFVCNLRPVNWTRKADNVVLCIQHGIKKGGKDQNQYNQVPHLTQDTKRESNKHTN